MSRRYQQEQRLELLTETALRMGPKWEKTVQVGEDVPAPGFKPVVGELAGKPVVNAPDMVDKSSGED